MLDRRRQGEQQLALRDEEVTLRLRRDDIAERRPEDSRCLIDDS